jgi:hypothetical protein
MGGGKKWPGSEQRRSAFRVCSFPASKTEFFNPKAEESPAYRPTARFEEGPNTGLPFFLMTSI